MDMAALGISVTNKGVDTAKKELDGLASSAKNAELASENLTKGATRAAAGLKAETDAARSTAGAMRDFAMGSDKAATSQGALAKQVLAVGNAHAIAAHNVGNMTQQLIDVGTTAAMGINPLMILIQQGGQIATVYAAAGVSLGAWATQYGLMLGILRKVPIANAEIVASNEAVALSAAQVNAANLAFVPTSQAAIAARAEMAAANVAMGETATAAAAAETVALTPLLPIILAVAAAIGVAAGAFELFKADTDKAANNDAFIASLGLSKKELKELKNTSITTGDVLKGFWRTIDSNGMVSKTFTSIKEVGVGAFRAVLEGVEWFVAGAYAGLQAVAHAIKGVAMVASGDFSGFDYFNHSLDNLISDTKAAKASMDQFWASVQKNTIAVNHEETAARAAAIRADGTAKAIRAERTAKEASEGSATTDPKWTVNEYWKQGGKITSWDKFTQLGTVRQVNELASSLANLPKLLTPIQDAFVSFGQAVGQSLGQAIAYSQDLGDAVGDMFKKMWAQYIANKISDIFTTIGKAFGSSGSNNWLASEVSSFFSGDSTLKANALGGVYSSPSLHSYVNGVYDRPQTFAFAKGGVFAEAGPEAIMPLSRGSNGKLGVTMNGGNSFNPREMAMAFVDHLSAELDRRAASSAQYSNAASAQAGVAGAQGGSAMSIARQAKISRNKLA
ncbi:MAG: phage tail length tape measure family protein [Asticcacaulis sp.]|uniref:hypothetical protein n=1 Tax=Asticcacaulis sp. TaxID=1872648 RepID=UPI0039E5EBFF